MATQTPDTKYILLADDDDDDTMLFVEAIEQLKTKVNISVANDGQELLSILDGKTTPDAIFLDLNMPKKSGIECLKSIRSDKAFERVPVVIYSTSQNKKDIDACFNAGANNYIIKPYDFDDIISILKMLFDQPESKLEVKTPREKFVINPGRENRLR